MDEQGPSPDAGPVVEVVEIPVISEAIRRLGVPLSPMTRAGGLLFLSGLPPLDIRTGALCTGDIESQTRASLTALQHTLVCAGSGLDRVAKVTVYASNTGHFDRINRVYAEFFPSGDGRPGPPARTFVAVASWPLDFDIEIECVALA